MSKTTRHDQQLNKMVLEGRALEAFERFYAEDVAMRENSQPPTVGKDANRRREEEFFASIDQVHTLELVSSATAGDLSLSEWIWDLTFKGGDRARIEQAVSRRWRDGQVAEERFYYEAGQPA